MPVHSVAPAGAPHHLAVSHHLLVEAELEANALLRVLEPFVIHDVLPHRIDVSALEAEGIVRLDLRFAADAELAERLAARLETMVTVSRAELMPTALEAAA